MLFNLKTYSFVILTRVFLWLNAISEAHYAMAIQAIVIDMPEFDRS